MCVEVVACSGFGIGKVGRYAIYVSHYSHGVLVDYFHLYGTEF